MSKFVLFLFSLLCFLHHLFPNILAFTMFSMIFVNQNLIIKCLKISLCLQFLRLDVQGVLKKASETPLKLEGNLLKVSTVFEPTHDRSILLAKNINSQTNEETFKSFVEIKRKADVLNVIFGENGQKAIVILKSEIGMPCN